jgi:hypothetical protein
MAHARPPVAKDFVVALSSGKWEVIVQPIHGVMLRGQAIVITPSRESRDRLDTWIHETLHTALPKLSESEVRRVAGDVSQVLWKAGYRRLVP